MTTTSTVDVWELIRDRLLTFAPPDGSSTLAQRLGPSAPFRFYFGSAPDNVTYPYAVARFTATRDGEDGDHRDVVFLELMFYNRPRGVGLKVIEACADVADQALYKWVSYTDGLVYSGPRQRQTLPLFPDPADRDIAAVRLLYRFVVWPQYLTRLS